LNTKHKVIAAITTIGGAGAYMFFAACYNELTNAELKIRSLTDDLHRADRATANAQLNNEELRRAVDGRNMIIRNLNGQVETRDHMVDSLHIKIQELKDLIEAMDLQSAVESNNQLDTIAKLRREVRRLTDDKNTIEAQYIELANHQEN
jgi:chromosome segregation ATPase